MKLTTRGRYAVTAMLDLAMHEDSAHGVHSAHSVPSTLSGVAQRRSIPLAYLEQLFARLSRRRLVVGVRGPGGGYRLARPVDSISLAQIMRAAGEGMEATRCGGAADCHGGARCLTHELWHDLEQCIENFLQNITLGSLVRRQRCLNASQAPAVPAVVGGEI